MLTTSQLREALAALRYRDGWLMVIEDDEHEGPYLRIVAPVTNSYSDSAITLGIDTSGGDPITLGITTYLSPNDRRGIASFYRFLIWRLERIESHEAREMLRYRDTGRAVYDPHAVP